MVISTFFEQRIKLLQSIADRREVHEMLYFYLQSQKGVAPVFARLDWFEHKDRITLSMRATWKNLAQSRADDDPVDTRFVKRLALCWICGWSAAVIGSCTSNMYWMPAKFIWWESWFVPFWKWWIPSSS
jgi:hypothetical protein